MYGTKGVFRDIRWEKLSSAEAIVCKTALYW